eukprot:gnl/MRDRNA2_/MRDRNA2_17882_c0_seq1.p1 gnl/MRDRNA2_/MRDRNA2_17882_c0~~gnl/MRDRNA2_/MRDRNA2_17882_c0_seq1.p1  ORF type:complete len:237 (-),score=30.35 gnl/MRDRNA2_/MRDRNA2_17882_c0_seq1:280-990(-)
MFKVEKVRHLLGTPNDLDIVMEDSMLEIEALGGQPGPMTKQFSPQLDKVISNLSADNRHASHQSYIYWDRGTRDSAHIAVSSKVEMKGILKETPSSLQNTEKGFDQFFHPDGWARRYREVVNESGTGAKVLESVECSAKKRVNLGCAMTRSFRRIFLNIVVRREIETRLMPKGAGEFATWEECKEFVKTRADYKSFGSNVNYNQSEDVQWVVDNLRTLGVGVGASNERRSPVQRHT